jgi:hypothetical protein
MGRRSRKQLKWPSVRRGEDINQHVRRAARGGVEHAQGCPQLYYTRRGVLRRIAIITFHGSNFQSSPESSIDAVNYLFNGERYLSFQLQANARIGLVLNTRPEDQRTRAPSNWLAPNLPWFLRPTLANRGPCWKFLQLLDPSCRNKLWLMKVSPSREKPDRPPAEFRFSQSQWE